MTFVTRCRQHSSPECPRILGQFTQELFHGSEAILFGGGQSARQNPAQPGWHVCLGRKVREVKWEIQYLEQELTRYDKLSTKD